MAPKNVIKRIEDYPIGGDIITDPITIAFPQDSNTYGMGKLNSGLGHHSMRLIVSKGTNLQVVLGHLGKDPEIRHTQSGATVATIDSRKDKNTGEGIEETEWHRIVLWNRLANLAEKYLRKGRQVCVRSRKKTRKWQGRTNYIVELIAEDIQLPGGKGLDTPADAPTHQSQDSATPNAAPNSLQNSDPGHFDDDVPL